MDPTSRLGSAELTTAVIVSDERERKLLTDLLTRRPETSRMTETRETAGWVAALVRRYSNVFGGRARRVSYCS